MLIFVAVFLGASCLRAADAALINPERGELQLIGEQVAFTPKASSLGSVSDDPGIFWIDGAGGVLLSAGLQDTKAHRPTERIIAGGLGSYNVGGASPCAGILIFIATGNQRPKLAGISDANGSFAVALPVHDDKSEIFIFFNGEIDILVSRDGNQNRVLKTGTSTVRYKVSIQKAEQAGTGQPATRPESKSEGSDKPKPEAEGRSR